MGVSVSNDGGCSHSVVSDKVQSPRERALALPHARLDQNKAGWEIVDREIADDNFRRCHGDGLAARWNNDRIRVILGITASQLRFAQRVNLVPVIRPPRSAFNSEELSVLATWVFGPKQH